jgi:cobalt-zinc-cadmium resistance protein CzcA
MRAIIHFSLARRPMMLAALLVFLAAGFLAFQRLNIEAYPDPAPPTVELITQVPGQSAEEIERYITIPIEIGLAGMPGLGFTRSISLYGLSDAKFQFGYDSDYYFSLQQVLNRVNQLTLPNGIQPVVSPASPTGEIYRYEVTGPPDFSLMDRKTLEDWTLERRFRTIPGVIDVVGWGGLTKEYHVEIDLKKLIAFKIPLPQLMQAISQSNLNVGARTIDVGQQAVNVRGIGLIGSTKDIDNIVLSQSSGAPVLLKDVARSSVGYAQRLGIIGKDDNPDIVEGIVLMRRGDKTREVVDRVEAEVEKMNTSGDLPPGVKVVPYYDRKDLVHVTTATVVENLTIGIVLVFLIQYLFLGNLRSALVVAATIPFALFFSITIMVLRGDSANLLSVGAIDFGIIVDSSVYMVENIFRRLQRQEPFGVLTAGTVLFPGAPEGIRGKLNRIYAAALEVDKAIFFSAAVTIAAFLPLFAMQGVEGQIFSPMAKTYGYALLGALIASFTVSPMLCSFLLPERTEERDPLIVRWLHSAYEWAIDLAFRFRYIVVAAGMTFLVVTGLLLPRIGGEFLPKLEEGNLWIRASLPPTISLAAGQPYVNRMRAIIHSYPQVTTVVTQHGRPDDGTDPTGFFNVEFFAPLYSVKDRAHWPKGLTKAALVDGMKQRLSGEFPGVVFNFSQNIEDNVEEAVSGVKGENSIKLFGPDLRILEDKSDEIAQRVEKVPGIQDVGVFHQLGQPNLLVKVDRERCARYGLAPNDVNTIVQAAIGGQVATTILEGERRFDLVVRLLPEYREDETRIRSIPVPTPGGSLVRLSDVADIGVEPGASYIYRENNRRYIPIKFSVRGRDLASAVEEAQRIVQKEVELPHGYSIEWSGEFGELKQAQQRLAWIVPASLLLIMVLLYSHFNTLRDSLMALAGIPFAACGGIWALYLTGINFSVSAAVGFISLFGVAVMDGIIMLTHYNELRDRGTEREDSIRQAARTCMRPRFMATLSACIGLLPAALSTGIGSQTQRPLATVIVGGMFLAPALLSIMVPVLRITLVPAGKHAPAS